MATYKIKIKQTNANNQQLSLKLEYPNYDDIIINNLNSGTQSNEIELTGWHDVDVNNITVSIINSDQGDKRYVLNTQTFNITRN